MLDLQPAADQVGSLVAGITDDQLDDPTPNAGRTVSALLAHLHGLSIAFTDAAKKVANPITSTSPNQGQLVLDPNWRTSIPQALAGLAAAWREATAWQGMTMAGGIQMTGEECGAVASNELVIHGWDLAAATRQPFSVAEANLQASYEFCSAVPDDAAAREGLFGPVVQVPDDAPLLARTLGYAGRDPAWTPKSEVP